MKRLGHGAKIGHDARALRRAQRNRQRALPGVKLVERSAGGGRTDGAENARGMPAFGVIVLGIATGQVSPDFVTRGVGRHHVLAA